MVSWSKSADNGCICCLKWRNNICSCFTVKFFLLFVVSTYPFSVSHIFIDFVTTAVSANSTSSSGCCATLHFRWLKLAGSPTKYLMTIDKQWKRSKYLEFYCYVRRICYCYDGPVLEHRAAARRLHCRVDLGDGGSAAVGRLRSDCAGPTVLVRPTGHQPAA